jgi:hypothetical protein
MSVRMIRGSRRRAPDRGGAAPAADGPQGACRQGGGGARWPPRVSSCPGRGGPGTGGAAPPHCPAPGAAPGGRSPGRPCPGALSRPAGARPGAGGCPQAGCPIRIRSRKLPFGRQARGARQVRDGRLAGGAGPKDTLNFHYRSVFSKIKCLPSIWPSIPGKPWRRRHNSQAYNRNPGGLSTIFRALPFHQR